MSFFGTLSNSNINTAPPNSISSIYKTSLQPTHANSACGYVLPQISTKVLTIPTFGSSLPLNENMASVINNTVSNDVTLFGYTHKALRFGNLDYYNSNYSTLPNTSLVIEKSLETASNHNVTPSTIEGYSENKFEYDLKLGELENPNNHMSLANGPVDTVTKARFSKTMGDLLAVASWDGTVRLWKISPQTGNSVFCYSIKNQGCVLDLDWTTEGKLILAHSDGTVLLIDISSRTAEVIGRHTGPVKAVSDCCISQNNLILSGSYDGHLKIWDKRAKTLAYAHDAKGKVYGIEYKNGTFSFINSSGELYVYALGNPPTLRLHRKLDDKFPLRSLSMDNFNSTRPNDIVVTVGTTNGRIYVVSLSANIKDLSFKSNRHKSPNSHRDQHAYPIHDLAFHPISKTLACCGGDGIMAVWDIKNKKSVYSTKQASLPITSTAYSSEGNIMAYAVGYDWSRGITSYKYKNNKPHIFIRYCKDELNYPPPRMIN